MNRISKRATKMYLNTKLEENEKYIKTLTEKIDIEQGEEIIQSIKDCLNNEESEQLIIEWNNLLDKANEIISKAKKIDLDFAKVFKL